MSIAGMNVPVVLAGVTRPTVPTFRSVINTLAGSAASLTAPQLMVAIGVLEDELERRGISESDGDDPGLPDTAVSVG
jgi:hypothetical protein